MLGDVVANVARILMLCAVHVYGVHHFLGQN